MILDSLEAYDGNFIAVFSMRKEFAQLSPPTFSYSMEVGRFRAFSRTCCVFRMEQSAVFETRYSPTLKY